MSRASAAGLLALLAIASPASGGAEGGYRTVRTLALAGGSLQILEDARLTPALAGKLWQASTDPVFVLGEDDPAAQTFKAHPLRPARLRQVDRAGAVVLDLVPDRQAPLARLETRRLGTAADPIFLVTTDNSAGFGSYSGLVTGLYAVKGGRLGPVVATGPTGKAEAITLADTLKSGWRIVDPSPTHTVIEQLLCRPDLGHEKAGQDQPFLLSYITYRSDGHGWRTAKRTAPGFWESDGAWPAASEFPAVGGK